MNPAAWMLSFKARKQATKYFMMFETIRRQGDVIG
jgi:hypothetical protein